jgi:ribosome small subunit-dependent GTPase A
MSYSTSLLQKFQAWFKEMARPALMATEKPDQIQEYDRQAAALEQLGGRHGELFPICVLGQARVGKSTLINALVPNANVATAEISQALNSGKHTTTSTTWHWVDAERKTGLIDSPGFQEFGLHHIPPMQLAQLMPDVRVHAQACRFHNCTHLHEPGCGVITEAQVQGRPSHITPNRWRLYRELFDELSQPPRY